MRLTGSGLGCSDWPLCTPDSLVPILEVQGIPRHHRVRQPADDGCGGDHRAGGRAAGPAPLQREARPGHRALVRRRRHRGAVAAFGIAAPLHFPASPIALGVLLIAVIAAAVRSIRTTPSRRDLVLLAWLVLIGVVAQALVRRHHGADRPQPLHRGLPLHLVPAARLHHGGVLVRLKTDGGPRERAVPRGSRLSPT